MIFCFGKTVECIQWTQSVTQREMQYLGRLEKWQLVQHCCAGTAKLVGPFPLRRLYNSMIRSKHLCFGKFPRYCLLWAGWGAKWENHCFLLALFLFPVLYHLSLAESLDDLWLDQANQNENLLMKSNMFFWIWISFPAFQQVNPFHSQTLFARGTKRTLCPWTSYSLPSAF